MNRSIRITSLFSLLLILVLVANLTWIQAFRDDDLAQNPLNARGFLEAKSTPRGQISTGGQVLAESSQDDQGFYQRSYITNPTAYAPVLVTSLMFMEQLAWNWDTTLSSTAVTLPCLPPSGWMSFLAALPMAQTLS